MKFYQLKFFKKNLFVFFCERETDLLEKVSKNYFSLGYLMSLKPEPERTKLDSPNWRRQLNNSPKYDKKFLFQNTLASEHSFRHQFSRNRKSCCLVMLESFELFSSTFFTLLKNKNYRGKILI